MRARRFFALLVAIGFGVSMVPAVPASATMPGSNGAIALETVDAQGAPWIGVFHPGQTGVDLLISMPDIHDPAWSPEGTRIAFAARASAGADLRIYVADADGSNAVAVSDGPNDDEPTWSPDGTEIAFTHHGAAAPEVDAVSLATGDQRKVSGILAAATSPTYSPDGSKVALSGQYLLGDPTGSCANACAVGIFVLASDGSGAPVPLILAASSTWTQPDWSPDGTRILVTIADATGTYGVLPISATTGAFTGPLLGFHGTEQGVWSPDGNRVAVDVPNAPSRGVVLFDLQGGLQGWILDTPAGDPSWASDVATPPTVEINMDLGTDGWAAGTQAFVRANAPQGIHDVSCDVDGGHPQAPTENQGGDPFSFQGTLLFFAVDGDHILSCTVTDDTGMSATERFPFRRDSTAPTLSNLTASPLVRRTDQVTNVSLSAVDASSGVSGGSIAYSSSSLSSSVPLTGDGSMHATIGTDLPGGIYTVAAQVGDRAHNLATAWIVDPLVVYDTRSHTFGRGAFVPTVFSSKLPGIDGRSKLWFRFSLHYARAKATRPVGWFGLDYPRSGFHVRVASLDWLARQSDRTYVVRGTAVVVGQPVPLNFIAYLTDGLGNADDSFDFRMWPLGAPVPGGLDTTTYAATGTLPAGTIVHDGSST